MTRDDLGALTVLGACMCVLLFAFWPATVEDAPLAESSEPIIVPTTTIALPFLKKDEVTGVGASGSLTDTRSAAAEEPSSPNAKATSSISSPRDFEVELAELDVEPSSRRRDLEVTASHSREGALSQYGLERAVEAWTAPERCAHEVQAGTDSDHSVRLLVTIEESGHASSADAVGSLKPVESSFAECLRERLLTLNLPRPESATRELLTFVF